MIRTAMQLKAKVRNISGSDSTKAQMLIRNFIMERFLERMAQSQYRDNFILKGGMLVASKVGLESRATMDIDTTVQSLNLSKEEATKVVEDIMAIEIDDGVSFRITSVSDIMEEHDYPGVRFHIEAMLDKMKQAIKVDISTGDVITPAAVEYEYGLMFEDRRINILSYNNETLLAEKLETIMSLGTTTTRMRDFYDIYIIQKEKDLDEKVLKEAMQATSRKRGSFELIRELPEILREVEEDDKMSAQWEKYTNDAYFIENLSWNGVMNSVRRLADKILE